MGADASRSPEQQLPGQACVYADHADKGQCPFQLPRQGRHGHAQRHGDQRGDGQDQRTRGGLRPGRERHVGDGGDHEREGQEEYQPAEDPLGRAVAGQEQELIDRPGGQGKEECPAADGPGDADDGDVQVPWILARPDVLAGNG
jgi:hypothetical protein